MLNLDPLNKVWMVNLTPVCLEKLSLKNNSSKSFGMS